MPYKTLDAMRRKASAMNQEVMLGITSQEVMPGETSGEVMPTSSGSDAPKIIGGSEAASQEAFSGQPID